jgi:glycosyltransferase involved in cell wall biosynthesis
MQGQRPLISFRENVPFTELISMEQRAVNQPLSPSTSAFTPTASYHAQVVFLHTMQNEHFGISLVEAMAAGNSVCF